MKLGIIGAGKMGSSIGLGVIRSGVFKKSDVFFADQYKMRIEELKNDGFVTMGNKEIYENSDIILLAIKPQQIEEVIIEVSSVENHAKTVICIAAGIPISYIKKHLKDVNVVRVMPNTPALINSGTSAIAFEKEEQIVIDIFKSIGHVEVISENMMNEVIPLNGSFPAFGYYFINSFIKAGMEAGFSYEVAKNLVTSSMIGTVKMILQSSKPINELIKDVCSPGGTTIEGVRVFDEKNLDGIVKECYEKCVKRAYELGK